MPLLSIPLVPFSGTPRSPHPPEVSGLIRCDGLTFRKPRPAYHLLLQPLSDVEADEFNRSRRTSPRLRRVHFSSALTGQAPTPLVASLLAPLPGEGGVGGSTQPASLRCWVTWLRCLMRMIKQLYSPDLSSACRMYYSAVECTVLDG